MADKAPGDRDLEIAWLLAALAKTEAPMERAKVLVDLARRYRRGARLDLARAALEEAHALAPEDPDVLRSIGLAVFGDGDWAKGLEFYDKGRWHLEEFDKYFRAFPQPQWNGEPLDGKHLLLWAEQGIGDQVMQARVLAPLLEQGAKITVEADPRMHKLIQRTHPAIACATQTVKLPKALVDGDFDFQCSMLSAWRFVELSGPQAGYLDVDQGLSEAFRAAWEQRGWKINVGLSWRSRAKASGSERSLRPELLRPLMQREDLTFHVLQYDTDEAEIGQVVQATGRPIYRDRDTDPLKDIDRQAAQIAALDLVISIDNATVHLAGAVGTECWALLPAGPDWRWGPEGAETDLYASLKLIRNTQISHWGGALADTVQALAAWRSR